MKTKTPTWEKMPGLSGYMLVSKRLDLCVIPAHRDYPGEWIVRSRALGKLDLKSLGSSVDAPGKPAMTLAEAQEAALTLVRTHLAKLAAEVGAPESP